MSRLTDWIVAQECVRWELRRSGDCVDEYDSEEPITDPEIALEIEAQFDKYAQWDTDEESRATTYQVWGIHKDGEKHRCPVQIRKRPETNSKFLEVISKQNTELHKLLVEGQKAITKELREINKELSGRVRELETDRRETFTLLESLRTRALERELMRERHEKELDVKDRLLDAGLPVLAAIGAKLTKQLPPADARINAIKQIAKGMQPEQVDRIAEILPDDETRDKIGRMLASAIDGQVNPDEFIREIKALPPATLMALRSVLNTGQALAVQTLLEVS